MAGKGKGIRAGRAFVEFFADDAKLVRAMRRLQGRLKRFGEQVRSIGARLGAVGTAAAAPFALGVRTFASFEKSMSRVAALSGASGEALAKLDAEAKRLGATTAFSASQAAEAMSFFALAGFSVEDIVGAVGPALNLAAAGQMDLAEAADIVAKVMAGMGMATEDVGNAVDVLTKAMTTANTDLPMLGEALKYVGPIAKSAGIRFEELVGAIQMLSNAGIQAEMAGTTLRGALLTLTSPSREAADTLARLGVRVADAAGNVRPLADILGDLESATASMGSAERLSVLGTIFDARQAAGVAELLSQGSARLREFTAALHGAGGTADRIASQQLDNLTGDVTILRSALEGLGIAVGQAFGEPLRAATQALSSAVSLVARWAEENARLVLLVGATAVGLAVLGGTLVAAGLAAALGAAAIGGLATALGVVGAVLGAVLSPVGLAVAGVAALAAAVLHFTGVAGAALAWIGERFGALREIVGPVVRGIVDALTGGDVELAAKILWSGLTAAFYAGKAEVLGIWFGLIDRLGRAWAEAWHGMRLLVLDSIVGAVKGALSAVGWLMAKLGDLLDSDTLRGWSEDLQGSRGALDVVAAQGREQIARDLNADLSSNRGDAAERAARLAEERQKALERYRAALEDSARAGEKRSAEDGQRPDLAGLLEAIRLPDIESGLQAAAERIASRGTFNALAIQSLAASGPAERTARAAEQTAENTKALLRAAQNGDGPVFTD